MLSHGVDIDRLNVMVMLGLPLATSEFIQTTSRVGRTYPGLVIVLHKIGRERDAAVYRTFPSFVAHADRLLDPVPITAKSRRVLELTFAGLEQGRLYGIHEPAALAAGLRQLTRPAAVRRAFSRLPVLEQSELAALVEMLGFAGPLDENLRGDLDDYLREFFRALNDPATQRRVGERAFPDRRADAFTARRRGAGARLLARGPIVRVERGASQILFGLLPGQTADLEGRIWRVSQWIDPVETTLDQDGVRSALTRRERTLDARGHRQRPRRGSTRARDRGDRPLEHGPRRARRTFPATVALQDMRDDHTKPRRPLPVRRPIPCTDAIRRLPHVRRSTRATPAEVPDAQLRRRTAPWHSDGPRTPLLLSGLPHHPVPGVSFPGLRLRRTAG